MQYRKKDACSVTSFRCLQQVSQTLNTKTNPIPGEKQNLPKEPYQGTTVIDAPFHIPKAHCKTPFMQATP